LDFICAHDIPHTDEAWPPEELAESWRIGRPASPKEGEKNTRGSETGDPSPLRGRRTAPAFALLLTLSKYSLVGPRGSTLRRPSPLCTYTTIPPLYSDN